MKETHVCTYMCAHVHIYIHTSTHVYTHIHLTTSPRNLVQKVSRKAGGAHF